MPATALQHFQEDIARTRAIVTHSDLLPHATDAEKLLRSDLFEHINTEFREFLVVVGCSPATIAQAGY